MSPFVTSLRFGPTRSTLAGMLAATVLVLISATWTGLMDLSAPTSGMLVVLVVAFRPLFLNAWHTSPT